MKNIFKGIKRRWMRYLDRLAKANEKEFGTNRLECCDLNKNKK